MISLQLIKINAKKIETTFVLKKKKVFLFFIWSFTGFYHTLSITISYVAGCYLQDANCLMTVLSTEIDMKIAFKSS